MTKIHENKEKPHPLEVIYGFSFLGTVTQQFTADNMMLWLVCWYVIGEIYIKHLHCHEALLSNFGSVTFLQPRLPFMKVVRREGERGD